MCFIFLNIIGGDIQPKRDLGRFVRWPKYIKLQRQKRILYQRLKVPPSINQFTQTLDQQTGIVQFLCLPLQLTNNACLSWNLLYGFLIFNFIP